MSFELVRIWVSTTTLLRCYVKNTKLRWRPRMSGATSGMGRTEFSAQAWYQCSDASCCSSGCKYHRWKCSDTTVAIPDDEEGDRLDRKLGSKSPCGWAKARSDPSRGPTTRQAVAKANRSEAAKCLPRLKRMTGVLGSAEPLDTRLRPMPSGKN